MQANKHRSPDRRVSGERQLARRGEDAQPRAMARFARGKHKHRLGMAELARNRLHDRRVEPFPIEHDRERIAGKAPIGEHVEGRKPAAHDLFPRFAAEVLVRAKIR